MKKYGHILEDTNKLTKNPALDLTTQSKAIDMLLTGREQMINNGIYRVLTGTSQVTASRQLNDLVKKGVLQPMKEHKGRSTAYELSLGRL